MEGKKKLILFDVDGTLTVPRNKINQEMIDKLEELMERLEKRLWLTVYGVAAVILAQAFQSFMVGIPN